MLTLLMAFALWPLTLGAWAIAGVIGLFLLTIGYFFEDDWYFKGFFFLGLAGAFLWYVGAFQNLDWKVVSAYAGGYVLAGVLWSLYKWVLHVRDLKRDLQAYFANKFTVNRENPNPTSHNDRVKYYSNLSWSELSKEEKGKELYEFVTHQHRGKYAQFLDKNEVKENLNVVPHLSTWGNRAKIISWIAYWPLSVANYVFGRLLKDLIDFIIDNLKGVYNMIAASIMKGLEI